jgi:hypothetical protein
VERCRQIDLQALLQWLRRSAAALCRRRPDDFHASDMSTMPVVVEDDHAEVAEVENTPVGAGDRE